VGVARVLAEEADLLGNAMLAGAVADGRDGYERIAGLAPPVLANDQTPATTKARTIGGPYLNVHWGTFIGSRVSAQKHSFNHMGSMNNMDIKQAFHVDTHHRLFTINNTYIGLLDGFTPATRWF
jgi:hypothetical protein